MSEPTSTQVLEILELPEPLVRGGGMVWQVRGDLREVAGAGANLDAQALTAALAPLGIDETTAECYQVTVGSRGGAEVLLGRVLERFGR